MSHPRTLFWATSIHDKYARILDCSTLTPLCSARGGRIVYRHTFSDWLQQLCWRPTGPFPSRMRQCSASLGMRALNLKDTKFAPIGCHYTSSLGSLQPGLVSVPLNNISGRPGSLRSCPVNVPARTRVFQWSAFPQSAMREKFVPRDPKRMTTHLTWFQTGDAFGPSKQADAP